MNLVSTILVAILAIIATAKAVDEAIAAAGINPNRLEPGGYGQERSVADNRTEEGRAMNRRVELVKR